MSRLQTLKVLKLLSELVKGCTVNENSSSSVKAYSIRPIVIYLLYISYHAYIYLIWMYIYELFTKNGGPTYSGFLWMDANTVEFGVSFGIAIGGTSHQYSFVIGSVVGILGPKNFVVNNHIIATNIDNLPLFLPRKFLICYLHKNY